MKTPCPDATVAQALPATRGDHRAKTRIVLHSPTAASDAVTTSGDQEQPIEKRRPNGKARNSSFFSTRNKPYKQEPRGPESARYLK